MNIKSLKEEWSNENFSNKTYITAYNTIAYYSEQLTGNRFTFHCLNLDIAVNKLDNIIKNY